MTKRRREGRLPGNDGRWFLELVGAEEQPPAPTTSLAELASPDPAAAVTHEGTATMGGHGGIVFGNEGGSSTAAESGAATTPSTTTDTGEFAVVPAPAATGPAALEHWTPEGLSRPLRSRRNFRWGVFGLALVVGAAATAAIIWLPRLAEQRAAVTADEYRTTLTDLRNELPDSQRTLAVLTSPETPDEDLSVVIPATAKLDAKADMVNQLATEPLPSTVVPLPRNPLRELADTREDMTFVGAAGESIATRMGRGYVYRTTMPLLLATPELPTVVTGSQQINELSVALASSLADSVDLVASLPSDPAFDSVRNEAIVAVQRFEDWTLDYLATLRTGDAVTAQALVDELETISTDLANRTTQALLVLRSDVDAEIIALAATIEAVLTAMPF